MPRRHLEQERYAKDDGVELDDFSKHPLKDEYSGDSTHEDDSILQSRLRSSSESSVESFELFTPDEEKRVVRKLDLHVVTFMSFLYLLSFLDRSSKFRNWCLSERTNRTDEEAKILATLKSQVSLETLI